MIQLIDPNLAGRSPELLPPVASSFDTVIHRADERYRFLHDNAVVWHGDALRAAWYNCPQGEILGESCIRSRLSRDEGRTWSAVDMIASDREGTGIHYVPVAFCSHAGRLLAFVSNMTGHDQVTRCEVFELDNANGKWHSRGFIADHFLPNCAPVRLENGSHIMFGRASESSAAKPAYPAAALQTGGDLTAPWRVVRISDRKLPLHPESTAWVEGSRVTALVRGGPGGGVHLFLSHDYGQTWEGPLANNLPAADTKLYAGRLNTGQRYLVWNWPDSPPRNTLVIGVSQPGQDRLDQVWRIRHGWDANLRCGPEWSYPCAVEHEGKLFVVYTSEKKHSVLTVIPASVLRGATVIAKQPNDSGPSTRGEA